MAKGGKREGAGRPKAQHTIEAEAAKKELVTMFVAMKKPIFEALLGKALTGDVPALKELFERVWGRESQPLTGDLNHTLNEVSSDAYKAILRRESERNSIKVSGD